MKNSGRINYDDLNESFWLPSCLSLTYHCCDPVYGIHMLPRVTKTFREKASYIAIVLSCWR